MIDLILFVLIVGVFFVGFNLGTMYGSVKNMINTLLEKINNR